jgi:hypothetical protein
MRRFYGLYLAVCNDIAMSPDLSDEDWSRVSAAGTAGREASQRHWQLPEDQIQHPDEYPSFSLQPIFGQDDAQRSAADALWSETVDWLKQELPGSPDAAADVRVIAPVMQNAAGSRARYWAVLGVQYKRLDAAFAVPPRTASFSETQAKLEDDEQGNVVLVNDEVRKWMEEHPQASYTKWRNASYLIPVYVFAEMTLGAEPPTREEFCAVCDQGGTPEQIAARLGRRFSPGGKLGAELWQLDWRLLAAAMVVLALLALLIARGVQTRRRAG